MAVDSLTLRNRNLSHLLKEEIDDQRNVGKQSIGKPEEGFRVHYDLFEKVVMRMPLLNGNRLWRLQILLPKFLDAFALIGVPSPHDGDGTKLAGACQHLLEDSLLL